MGPGQPLAAEGSQTDSATETPPRRDPLGSTHRFLDRTSDSDV